MASPDDSALNGLMKITEATAKAYGNAESYIRARYGVSVARLLRRAASRLDPQPRISISVAMATDIAGYIAGMNRASKGSTDG